MRDKIVKIVNKVGLELDALWDSFFELHRKESESGRSQNEDYAKIWLELIKVSQKKHLLQKRLRRVYDYCDRHQVDKYYRLRQPASLDQCLDFLSCYRTTKKEYLTNLVSQINGDRKKLGINRETKISEILGKFSLRVDMSFSNEFVKNFFAYSMLYHYQDKFINNNGAIELYD